jgi:acetyl-CoA C-acetyltransferase
MKNVVTNAVRTPIGDFGCSLKAMKPIDLIIAVMKDVLASAQLDKEAVDQVIIGNCIAPIDQNVARVSSLMMGVPYEAPGYTINCACASASQAISTALGYENGELEDSQVEFMGRPIHNLVDVFGNCNLFNLVFFK